ncbi:MAG: flagellar export chaperone FliS [Blastochloris viridis]|uniref:Flagellar export chaperone FliS n=1 Tax=Blastochloris viridis TaxID=1079 RepID=A0A6N4RAJ5_BLAVI|nr:MAG: flagellar export chaperone FliS [Blastochloris viridis]
MTYGNNHQRDTQQYLRQQIEQAGPVEQVIMLYDGVMRFMLQAKTAIENGDIQGRCNANRRAMEIVAYLIDLVNPESGGEVGKRMFGIYSGMLKRMLEIDMRNDPRVCDEMIQAMRTLRTATAQTLAEQQGLKPAVPAAGTVVSAPKPSDEELEKLRRNAVA